jgi:hypothetical protein
VDLDNLVGGTGHAGRVRGSIGRYLQAADVASGDHLVVAAGTKLARTAAFEMPRGTRFLVGSGLDGADRRLLGAVPPDHVARRYDRLVLGSGDGCFVDFVTRTRRLGAPVTVIGPADGTSRELRLAADRYVPFDVELIEAAA